MTAFEDEFEIARIRVGVTPERELNTHVQPIHYKGPAGYQRQGDAGETLHYYTNEGRTAVLCAGCRQGVVQHVRLKRGFWGPLTELASIPPEADSQCSLHMMGTSHGVHMGPKTDDRMNDLFLGLDRILKVYGPPSRETGGTLHYDWLFEPTPRRMTFRLEGGGIVDMFLELLDPTQSQGMRPLGPAQPFLRIPPLPATLRSQMEAGEEHLREGRPQEAERLFGEVLEALCGDDPNVHDVNVEVAARHALARASMGHGGPAQVKRVVGLLEHLERYASYNPPEVLRMRLALGQVRRLTGDPKGALKELQKLWGLLQASDYYTQPEVQDLVRQTAAELELVGEARYAEEIRRQAHE